MRKGVTWSLSVPWSNVKFPLKTLVAQFLCSESFFYHPALPSTICFATSNGSITPFIRSSVTALMASRHASIGDRHTYQPAQKNPTGQAKNQRTRNQMIAHSMFMSSSSVTLDVCNKTEDKSWLMLWSRQPFSLSPVQSLSTCHGHRGRPRLYFFLGPETYIKNALCSLSFAPETGLSCS